MKIVIEGCDGVGKTSVAKILANKYGCDVVHMTGEDPRDFDFYYQSLRKENIIYDRNVLGERVYPFVFGRPTRLSNIEMTRILMDRGDVHFFVLTSNVEEIARRIEKRGNEDERIKQALEYITSKFFVLAYENNIPIVDTTDKSAEQVASEIITIIEEREKQS